MLGDDKIQRKYAVETYRAVEEYEADKIKEAVKKHHEERKDQRMRQL